MANSEKEKIAFPVEQASAWAENCLRINHLNTLVQREIADGKHERAKELSERARVRAWTMFNEMIALGAKKPEGYCGPDDAA
jgi:hypothetical protein